MSYYNNKKQGGITLTLQEEHIISTLIGLVGACETNPKTSNTDTLIIKALVFPFMEYKTLDEKTLLSQEIINEIYIEKNKISPNCAQCSSPCGNTSDYDMQRIYKAKEPIRKLKLQLLSELQNLALHLYQHPNQITTSESEILFLYKALSFLGCDREEEAFIQILEEANHLRKELPLF